ncbi:hypothetical protein H4R18_003137 [Coemansia javaensis]|uniref:DUF1742-domain-containing protein n=1 Tax=Coemansia javaensis TaxID=2761396 RepID=A0A9W8LI56_9FUNG|nr:hypothetical protein H4R18_003137 [Coemansia javaensis]
MSRQGRPALPENRYVQRTAVKAGPCFICGALVPTLLVTEKDTPRDWFFVCIAHTQTTAFCTIDKQEGSSSSGVVDKAEAKTEEKVEDKSENKIEDKTEDKIEDKTEAKTESKPGTSSPANAQVRYILHNDYLYLRKRPFIKRWEQEQADLLAQQLPSVPRTPLR